MRRALTFFILAVVLSGCASHTPEATLTEPVYRINYLGPEKLPQFEIPSKLSLIVDQREIKLGVPVGDMTELFPKPPKSFDFRDLPPGFPDTYRSRGWENEQESVGWVSYNGQVALILRTVISADEEVLEAEYLNPLQNRFPDIAPILIAGKTARFWFWQDGNQRLMVCAGKSRKQGVDITMALGDISLMDALRMMPSKATFDKDRADNAWLNAEQAQPKAK